MPYLHMAQSMDANAKFREEWVREFDRLRAELDNIRTQYALVLAKLDADAGVTDTNYAALGVLAASVFTRT